MSIHKRYMAYRKGELYHYNKNHDPKNGQFTSGPGGASAAVAASRDPEYDKKHFGFYAYDVDNNVLERAQDTIYKKVLPAINGVDPSDHEYEELVGWELADHFYTEYKNYVHDHPEEKGRVDDYVEYVKANATKVDPAFTVRDENNNNDSYSARPSTPPAPDYEQNYRDRVMRVAANDREFQLMYQRKASDTSLDFWDRYDAQDLADYYKQEADSSERLARVTDDVYAFKPSADEKRLEKTNAELSKLNRFDEPSPDVSKTKPGSDERLRALDYYNLQKTIEAASGDWYNSEPKSDRWKKIYSDAEKNDKRVSEYDLAKAALLDMGYKPTPENIEYLVRRHVIFWD